MNDYGNLCATASNSEGLRFEVRKADDGYCLFCFASDGILTEDYGMTYLEAHAKGLELLGLTCNWRV